jgi:hypothetical protein
VAGRCAAPARAAWVIGLTRIALPGLPAARLTAAYRGDPAWSRRGGRHRRMHRSNDQTVEPTKPPGHGASGSADRSSSLNPSAICP